MPDDEARGGGPPDVGGPPRYPTVANPDGYWNQPAPSRRSRHEPPDFFDDRRRGLADYAMPAAVILAGALTVIAVVLYLTNSTRSDEQTAAPQPAPPAADATTPADDQPIIPLPSPSATPSASPSAQPSAEPSKSAPPTRKPNPPDTGSIRIERGNVPSRVDLSAEGRRDWVHWGELSTFSLERDKDGDFAIREGSPTAPRFRHGLSPQSFTWRGGAPVDNSSGTPTGIRTCGKGNGFTLTAPASTGTRTLRLYVGVVAGRGQLNAKLSTGGDASSARLEQRGGALKTAVFTVTFRAPRSATLKLSSVTDAAFDSDCGGVALQAATLR